MTAKPDLNIRAGQIVTFSSGEYSDYELHDTFVAIADTTVDELKAIEQQANDACGEDEEQDDDPHYVFLSLLIRSGRFLQVPMRELHLGSYGRLEPYWK